MKKVIINLDEMLETGGQAEQLFRIIARQVMLPLQVRVSDPEEGWSITFTIDKYGKFGG